MKYYSEHSQEYIENTKDANMKNLYSFFERYIPSNAQKIMDLGFGSGRDSLYFKSKGYEVLSLDPTLEFCEYGKSIGLNVGESCLVSLSYKNSSGSYSSIHDCTMTKLGVPQTETGYVGRPCYVISMFPNCHSFYNNIDVFKGSLYIAIENNKITIYTANKTDLQLYEYYR